MAEYRKKHPNIAAALAKTEGTSVPYDAAYPTQANAEQVGGAHYKQLDPQPWDVIGAWGLGFLDGNVVKYVARYRNKGGIKDLKKAQHYLTKLIEVESRGVTLRSMSHPNNPAIFRQGD